MKHPVAVLFPMCFIAAVAAGCSALPEATTTPAPTPRATPTPPPAPTATPVAPAGVDPRLAEALADLPSSVRLAAYLDIAAINTNPKLKTAAEEVTARYLGKVGTAANSLGAIDRVAVGLQGPTQIALKGSFSGALIVTSLAAGGSPTTEYKGVRYAQFSRDAPPGSPRFIAFPSRSTALLAETAAAMEGLIDMQTAGPQARFIANDTVIATIRSIGSGAVVAIGQPGSLDRLAPAALALGATFGGVAASPVDSDTVGVAASARFSGENAAALAEAAMKDMAQAGKLFNAAVITQARDIAITRNGAEIVVKLNIPVDVMVNAIRNEVRP